MYSIDQYYEMTRLELEALAREASNSAKSMEGKLDVHPYNRPLPSGATDMLARVATIQRLTARFSLLCELGVANKLGTFPEPVSLIPLEKFPEN